MEQGIAEKEIEIKRFIEELKTSNINFENYKQYFKKIKDADIGIEFNVDSNTKKWESLDAKHRDFIMHPKYKEDKNNGFVKLFMFDLVDEMHSLLKDILTQKIIQQEMYSAILTKLYETLDDAKALEIKKDALNEMREMDNKRNEMTLEIVRETNRQAHDTMNAKFQNYDEKIFGILARVTENMAEDRKLMLEKLEKISENRVPDIPNRMNYNFSEERRPNHSPFGSHDYGTPMESPNETPKSRESKYQQLKEPARPNGIDYSSTEYSPDEVFNQHDKELEERKNQEENKKKKVGRPKKNTIDAIDNKFANMPLPDTDSNAGENEYRR